MIRKWRPSLAIVLGGALAATLALSLAGLVLLRYLGPEIGFRNAAALIAVAIGAATALLGLLLVRLLLRPIQALAGYARAVRSGPADVGAPPTRFGTRELHRLAEAVVDMSNTLRLREQTIRSYSDHVTHQLKSPASAIAAAAELLSDGAADRRTEDRRLIEQISGAAGEIRTQLDALREMARAREANYFGSTTLSETVRELTTEDGTPALAIEGGHVPVPMSARGLALVLGQLIENAAHHGAGRVLLAADTRAEHILVSVSDDGHGISAGNIDRVFDPFFTTRREDGGTGMGLAIVASILQSHGAEISVSSSGAGAAFELRFTNA